jgi:two-component system phosphate regulon response regulator PhoB
MSEPQLIVVADDDPDVRDLLGLQLRSAGYEVVAAADGDEALHAVMEHAPALVLLDVNMPQRSGIDVVARLRAQRETRHLPIMLVSAKGREKDVAYGLEAGADDYITKPYRREELLRRVSDMLHGAAALAERRAELTRQFGPDATR